MIHGHTHTHQEKTLLTLTIQIYMKTTLMKMTCREAEKEADRKVTLCVGVGERETSKLLLL